MSSPLPPEYDLPASHPARADGMSGARQCAECGGIWYPGADACPYCNDDDEEQTDG